MRLDGFGLFVNDMAKMIRFYRDVLGFEIKEAEDTSNVYLVKDGTLFLLYGRKDFEKMTNTRYEYVKGLNGYRFQNQTSSFCRHCKREYESGQGIERE